MGGLSSKEKFGVVLTKLADEDVDPALHDFWDEVWKTSLTSEEIFEVATTESLKAILARPRNLRTLFSQAVAQIYQVVETPYPVYFNQALNCTRVLSRILPIMLAAGGQQSVRNIFWAVAKTKSPHRQGRDRDDLDDGDSHAINLSSLSSKRAAAAVKFKIPHSGNDPEDAKAENSDPERDSDGGDGNNSGDNSNDEAMDDDGRVDSLAATQEPLAVVLVNSLFHMLFLPDFSIEDPNLDFGEEDVNSKEFKAALMWGPGVGSPEKSVTISSQFDENRIEVLRVMLAAFCDPLYHSPHSYNPCDSLWLLIRL